MPDSLITFGNVSRFYGEVLGINKVSLAIPPGITSLVGPNGSGKTTLMNLMTGLIRPTQGEIRVLGVTPDHPEKLCRIVGYCAQFDAFPKGLSGHQFVYSRQSDPNANIVCLGCACVPTIKQALDGAGVAKPSAGDISDARMVDAPPFPSRSASIR